MGWPEEIAHSHNQAEEVRTSRANDIASVALLELRKVSNDVAAILLLLKARERHLGALDVLLGVLYNEETEERARDRE